MRVREERGGGRKLHGGVRAPCTLHLRKPIYSPLLPSLPMLVLIVHGSICCDTIFLLLVTIIIIIILSTDSRPEVVGGLGQVIVHGDHVAAVGRYEVDVEQVDAAGQALGVHGNLEGAPVVEDANGPEEVLLAVEESEGRGQGHEGRERVHGIEAVDELGRRRPVEGRQEVIDHGASAARDGRLEEPAPERVAPTRCDVLVVNVRDDALLREGGCIPSHHYHYDEDECRHRLLLPEHASEVNAVAARRLMPSRFSVWLVERLA